MSIEKVRPAMQRLKAGRSPQKKARDEACWQGLVTAGKMTVGTATEPSRLVTERCVCKKCHCLERGWTSRGHFKCDGCTMGRHETRLPQ